MMLSVHSNPGQSGPNCCQGHQNTKSPLRKPRSRKRAMAKESMYPDVNSKAEESKIKKYRGYPQAGRAINNCWYYHEVIEGLKQANFIVSIFEREARNL